MKQNNIKLLYLLMQVEWCFVQDKDGSYYVIQALPQNLYKDKDQWCCIDCESDWIKVNNIDDSGFIVRNCTIDFTNIPTPKWEDTSPIVIVQQIKQTYYTLDEDSSN